MVWFIFLTHKISGNMQINLKPKYNHLSMGLLNKCNEVLVNHNQQKIHHSQNRFKHITKAINSISNGLKLAAYAIAFVATYVFEKCRESSCRSEFQRKTKTQVLSDIAGFNSQQRNMDTVQKEIREFINTEQLFLNKSPEKIAKYEQQALSSYASSYMNYSPVVIEWVHSVLETAMASVPPKRVVFLARDGIAPYEVAKILQQKHPKKYSKVPLSLLYISRKVKDWATENETNKKLFIEYVKQEGLKFNEKCLFIDVGFLGSMIQPVKQMLKDLTPDIQFGYLVSHTQEAHGFMANMEVKLESVKAAGNNAAVRWLEDTHQGVKNSATKLTKDEKGIIHPYIINKKGHSTCKEENPKSYLYKYFGLKAVIDGANDKNLNTQYIKDLNGIPQQWNMATQKSKEIFDQFLMQYFNGKRSSFTKHI